jgi:hypothetical protein
MWRYFGSNFELILVSALHKWNFSFDGVLGEKADLVAAAPAAHAAYVVS